MQELRFVAVSEDCRYAVLAVPGRSARFTLPIDERLRAVALGQTSRLAQYEIEVESPLRPKEIQARIRAGETVEEIADAAGIAAERVRWFEGPVLAERAYMADQAQLASVRRQGDATPGPRLGEIVTERLKAFGADPEDAQWDAKKSGDSSWQVELTFISGGRLHTAEWMFDPRRRHVLPADDNAARMSLPGTEPPQPAAPPPGEATITHLAPRLSSAAAHGAPIHSAPGHSAPGHAAPSHAGPDYGPGFGQSGTGTSGFGPGAMGNGGRARHERPGSGRPSVPETQVGEPTAPEPRETEAPAAVAPSVPSAPPVTPAAVAAQISRAAPGPQPGRVSQAPQASHPARDARMPQNPGRPGASSGNPCGGVLDCRGLRRVVSGSGRVGSVTRRGAPFGPGGTRGRAGNASGPQGSARQALLGAVLGRDHVRQFAPARLALTATLALSPAQCHWWTST